jgi:hypothetical protein
MRHVGHREIIEIDDVNAGIEAAPLSAFCIKAHLRPGLVLGFASTPSAEIEAATADWRAPSKRWRIAGKERRSIRRAPPARAIKQVDR